MADEVIPSRRDAPPVTAVTGGAGWFGQAFLHALVDTDGPWHRAGTIRALCHNDDAAVVIDHGPMPPFW